ncbi:hypothetical protein EZH22_02835 [Xanthobacter dioxanivorans]|uniref:Uncharacterized protein n=1 Tax=Xanthobacter dioxanivorans TaxID=2528964 RepID=A0A974PPZ4_9HYPH|nr:hypothetical protein [Xanthobacter dioxanivorans]QRG07366.1 hypothetical protein EZH22_02835 [Xanthobacter dioxanivorans]
MRNGITWWPMGGRIARLAMAPVLLGALALPAHALMPPYVYENARADAKSVIVIAVEKVDAPRREFGTCTVSGTVKVVERGTAFTAGQKVEIAVSCARKDASPPLGGTIYQQQETLVKSKFGRAWLDADGKVVLSQYEQLAAVP